MQLCPTLTVPTNISDQEKEFRSGWSKYLVWCEEVVLGFEKGKGKPEIISPTSSFSAYENFYTWKFVTNTVSRLTYSRCVSVGNIPIFSLASYLYDLSSSIV